MENSSFPNILILFHRRPVGFEPLYHRLPIHHSILWLLWEPSAVVAI